MLDNTIFANKPLTSLQSLRENAYPVGFDGFPGK
jgi:hypothetical protein